MSINTLADSLVALIPESADGLFNPWKDRCEFDSDGNGPAQRVERLRAHLDCDPALILIGEAPGYKGCRYAGVAFTNERLIIEGAVPRVTANAARLTKAARPFSEQSASIVWKELHRHGVADRTVMWNALQLHPHPVGDYLDNRTPSRAELMLGRPALLLLLKSFPKAIVVAVGKKAEETLTALDSPAHDAVRHPANGGATRFREGLQRIISERGVRGAVTSEFSLN